MFDCGRVAYVASAEADWLAVCVSIINSRLAIRGVNNFYKVEFVAMHDIFDRVIRFNTLSILVLYLLLIIYYDL
jgi:hypothetical protein